MKIITALFIFLSFGAWLMNFYFLMGGLSILFTIFLFRRTWFPPK
jgi:hypothetical protein